MWQWTNGWAMGVGNAPGGSALEKAGRLVVYSCDGCVLVSEDDASLIARVLNSHDALLEAAKAALSCLEAVYGKQFEGDDDYEPNDEPQHTTQLLLAAAIAAVERRNT